MTTADEHRKVSIKFWSAMITAVVLGVVAGYLVGTTGGSMQIAGLTGVLTAWLSFGFECQSRFIERVLLYVFCAVLVLMLYVPIAGKLTSPLATGARIAFMSFLILPPLSRAFVSLAAFLLCRRAAPTSKRPD